VKPAHGLCLYCKERFITRRARDFNSDSGNSLCSRLHAEKCAPHNENVAASAFHRWSTRAESPPDYGSPKALMEQSSTSPILRARDSARCETGHTSPVRVTIDLDRLVSLQFAGRQHIMAAERTANLADDIAAFAYARENLLPELRKNGEHHSPNLTVTVSDESRPVIFSIPCLQGNACGASQTCPPFQLRQAFRRRVRFSMSRGPPLSSNIR
jgi:hypothetical protein